MRKHNAENERMKYKYIIYQREAEGKDEKSLDKILAALVRFEESNGYKSFKRFHTDQAGHFKKHLRRAKGPNGKPLSHATIDANLRIVKGFFKWLAGQSGYKQVLSYSDANYFNNNMKDARFAHTQRQVQYPPVEAAAHAFQAMPEQSEIQLRDKAVFACLMLVCARASALASLRLKHVNLVDGHIYQDGREVKTKNSKYDHLCVFSSSSILP